MIVDTEKVLREADGPEESDFHEEVCLGWKGESPLGAPQRTDGRAGEGARRSQALHHTDRRLMVLRKEQRAE